MAPKPARGSARASFSELLAWLGTLLLVAAFLIPGLIGHDPWKQDEAYVFGVVYHVIQTGDWVVPKLAGEPFLEKPILFYLLAAGFARALQTWLPLHDGARVASGFCALIAIACVGSIARFTWGSTQARGAIILLIACIGLLAHAHFLITDMGLVAGFAIAYLGFAMLPQQPRFAGLVLGTGVGIGFLAKGLLAPGVFLVSALLLIPCAPAWRSRGYFSGLGIACVAVLPWLLVWPIALYQESPALFHEWLWLNNVGRFIGFSVSQLGAASRPGFYAGLLWWFLWPAWPFALLAMWYGGRYAWRSPQVQLAAMLFAVTLIVLATAASARDQYALPLLLPCAVLASGGLQAAPAWLFSLLRYVALVVFGALAVWVWVVWISAMANGHAPAWSGLARWLPLEFIWSFGQLAFAGALTLTLLWVAMVAMTWSRRDSGLYMWTAGLVLWWGLLLTLWEPWLDEAKSYRSMLAGMVRSLPKSYDCISNVGLGEPQRGVLHYLHGIVTRRAADASSAKCAYLLLQGFRSDFASPLPAPWRELWRGARPGDANELFVLATRSAQSAARQ